MFFKTFSIYKKKKNYSAVKYSTLLVITKLIKKSKTLVPITLFPPHLLPAERAAGGGEGSEKKKIQKTPKRCLHVPFSFKKNCENFDFD